MDFERFSDKIEKRIVDFTKLPPIAFKNPESPQSCYRDWKLLFHLRLEQFQFLAFITQNKAASINALWNLFNQIAPPTPQQTQMLEDLVQRIDIAVQSLLLLSLPNQILQDNGSFIKICQDRPITDGASFTIFNRIEAIFNHKVEIEKVELMAQLSKLINSNEPMSTYIGVKQTARAVLDERFASKYDDAFQRTYLLAGIREEKEYKTLYEHLLQQQNQSLIDTITAMEIFAREKQVKTSSSSSSAISSSSALLTSNSQSQNQKGKKNGRNRGNQKQQKGENKKERKKTDEKPSIPHQSPCRNFATKGNCFRGDKCFHKHVAGSTLRQTPCPYPSNCRNYTNGTCMYQPSSHSSPSSSSSSSANTATSDSWGLTVNPNEHF